MNSTRIKKKHIKFNIVTFVESRSGTVVGFGGQAALMLFLLKAREREPVTQQARTKRQAIFVILILI